MQASRARRTVGTKLPWLSSLLLVVACSGSESIDFFEPDDAVGGGTTGGSSGTDAGGSSTGGSSGAGATVTGGTSGDTTGGTGADPTGGTAGETGGTGTQGGTGADAGMGGSSTTGGQGGDAGSAVGGTSMGGAGMGGAGTGGAGTGGAGTGGAGMGGAGMGGAGMGGKGGKGGMAGAAGCMPTMPSTERCDGVDNNCMGGVDEGTACPANCTGATRAGHWYIFCSFESASGTNTARSWAEAEAFCAQRNLGLVFIESAEENAFITAWITRMMLESQVWMGANDRDPTLGLSNEGTWVWGSANNAVEFWDGDENGEPVMARYNDWAVGEPNNMGNEDCGVLSAEHDYAWDDRLCTNEYENFVCESTGATTVGP